MEVLRRRNLLAAILADLAIRMLIGYANGCFSIPYLLQALVHHLLFLGLGMLIFQGTWGKRLLAAVSLLTVQTLAGTFVGSLASMVLLFGLHLANPDPELVFGEGLIWLLECLVYLAVVAVILTLPWFLRKMPEMEGDRVRPGKWYLTLAVPLLGFVALTDVAQWGATHGILVRSGGWLGLYYDELLSHGGMCVLTALSMVAAAFFLFGMGQMDLEQQKSSRYHAQIAAYETLKQQHRQTEGLRHDMKNHILALQGLAREQAWETLEAYLGNMADSCGLYTGRTATGSRVTDILLEQKERQARELGIFWDCQVEIPDACRICDMDWCILWGNLLDNAIRACAAVASQNAIEACAAAVSPFIRLRGGQVKGCFLLEIKNSVGIENEERVDTAKSQKTAGRGVGLLNVRDMVERNSGTLKISREQECFVVTVLLPFGSSGRPFEPKC